METMAVTVPEGMGPGMTMTVNVKGQDMNLTIPAGVGPGMQFQFQVPAMQPQPVMAQPVMAQPVMAQGVPVQGGYPQQPMGYGQQPQVIMQQAQPNQVVLVQQPQVRMMEEQYCGIVSWLIGCFVPCGCWICLCPVDTRLVPVQ